MLEDPIAKFLSRPRVAALRDAFASPQRAARAEPFRVVIAGGGVAAIEAGLALHELAGDRIELTLLAADRTFTYRPLEVREPFAGASAPTFDLAELAASIGAELVTDRLTRVDAAERQVLTADGSVLGYDALLLCLGATPAHHDGRGRVITPGRLDELLHGFVQDVEGEYIRSAAIIVPDRVGWPLPAYELALMTAERASGMLAEVDLTLITSEPEPLAAFGPEASAAVRARLVEAGVTLITSAHASVPGNKLVEVTTAAGRRQLEVDSIIVLPELEGPALSGLPQDEQGFLPVDPFARVLGVERVFAAGDATDGSIKQGGIAAQQADVAAAGIAHLAGAAVSVVPLSPVMRGVLMTGGAPLVLGTPFHGQSGGDADGTATSPAKIAAPRLSAYLATREPLAAARG